jgi:tripeptide aminopeptidase
MINRERLYSLFIELCGIDSEPTRERLLAERLTGLLADLGFAVEEDDTGKKIGGNAGNLIARLAGSGPGEPLLFSCHMDRVAPGVGVKPRIEAEFIVSDGTTVLGADDAAGLAALIEGLAALRDGNVPHPPIEVIFTVAEELALLGSTHLDTGRITSRCGFVLDAGGPVGEIVVQAPEQVKINAVFHGRSAHAGFAPEQGISAIQMAAAAIGGMKLLRIDPETTANIGSIHAVGPTNIVPSRCELQAEVRSLDPAKLRAQASEMIAAMESAAKESGGRVETAIVECYPSYSIAEDAGPAQRAAGAAGRIGVPVRFKPTGGGSDANIFNSRGIPSVVLSCGYEKVHTTEERIALDQLALLAEWVVEIIAGGALNDVYL